MPDPATGFATGPTTDRAAFTGVVAAALDSLPAVADGRAVWRTLGHGGVLAALYPARGGPPRPDRLAILLSELDARLPVGPVLTVCVQAASALPLLGAEPMTELARKLQEAALGGDLVLALAATDAGASGSDLLAAGTTAVLADEYVLIDGAKQWITSACTADYALVLARHRPARHFTSFVWVLVPLGAAGVTATPAATELFAGSGVGQLRFDGVSVGRDHLVGRPGRAMASFARHVSTERLASGLWARAICHRVLVQTRATLASAPLNGRAAWDNDAIRERFARCLVRLRGLDAACDSYAASFDGPGGMLAGMLFKVAAADCLQYVVGECVQLRGSASFADQGLAQLHAAVAAWSLAGGATGAMLAGIADHADELLAAT